MFASANTGMKYVDRGDPLTWDFLKGDFDFELYGGVLELPACVPANAKVIEIIVMAQSPDIGTQLTFYTPGNTNFINMLWMCINVANQETAEKVSIFVGGSHKIEYCLSLNNYDVLNMSVSGWWV